MPGIWAGDGRAGAKFWLGVLSEINDRSGIPRNEVLLETMVWVSDYGFSS